MKARLIASLSAGCALAVVACVVAKQDTDGTGATNPLSSPANGAAPTPTTPVATGVGSLTGARTFDWTDARVTGRATRGVDPAQLLAANGGGHGVDWNVTTGAPVTTSAAVYGTSWVESSPNAADMLFFAVNAASGAGGGITGGASSTAANNNIFALNNLYGTTPTLLWSASLSTGGSDRGGLALSADGSKVYAVDTGGTLTCLKTANGATCASPWANYSNGGCAVHGSAPWINFQVGTDDIYFGDDCGYVQRVNGSTGAKVWRMQPGASSTYQGKFESSPVVLNGYIFIGDDLGQLWRLTDTTASTGPSSGGTLSIAVCSAVGSTAPCAAAWAIRAPISLDTTNNHVYAVANDYVFEMGAISAGWAETSSSPKHLNSGGTGPMYAAAALDSTNKFLYTGFNSRLFKIPFPFEGSSTSGIYTTTLAAGSGSNNPTGDPLAYNSVTYVGDANGETERFSCSAQAGVAAVDGVTPSYGASVNTAMILDYSTGNVNFGYTATGGTTGGLVQYPLAVASYTCPTATPHLCTASNGPANTCSESDGGAYGEACRQCCTNGDCSGGTPECVGGTCQATCSGSCPLLPNATGVCASGACSYTCNTGFANCDGTITTNGCNINTTTDVNNCGGCGNACSTNNIPVPACSASVCTGHCSDGWVDCNGNRLTDGCESLAQCGSCCSNVCATGYTCYDNGSTGACVMNQTTQAAATASQNGSLTVSCPTGMEMTSITFADYGTPQGTQGQSWMNTTACASLSSSGTCGAATGCTWVTSSTGSSCITAACWNQSTNAACGATAGCSWSAPTGSCTLTTCFNQTSSTTCAATSGCSWDSALAVCTASIGFLHEYGQSSNSTNTYPPSCAMDVSQDTVVTACVGNASCTIQDADGVLGTGAVTASGSTLPLSTVPSSGGAPAAYPSDPCPSFSKSMDLQATCGSCAGATAAYADPSSPVGNQGWTGSLGLDFQVNDSIEVTSLGAYDPNHNSYASGAITVAIYNIGTQAILTQSGTPLEATFSNGEAGLSGLVAGSDDQFLTLTTPIVLGPGTYSVVAWGYNASEKNYNSGGGAGISTENGAGLISFIGAGRYNSVTTGIAFPTTVDLGGTNRYSAGTFKFIATPAGICTVGGGVAPCAAGSTCSSGTGCVSGVCENSQCVGNITTYDAYADPTRVGNQNYTGSLGMDFTVNNPITVTQVGAFDSGADGFTNTITVGIWNSSGTTCSATGTSIVAGTQVTLTGTSQPLFNGDRFVTLPSPVTLPVGQYTIVAVGFGASDANYNSSGAAGGANTESTGGGDITFTGNACFNNTGSTAFVYPTTADTGQANRYGAGTFLFQ